jgi:hypothetical protein
MGVPKQPKEQRMKIFAWLALISNSGALVP